MWFSTERGGFSSPPLVVQESTVLCVLCVGVCMNTCPHMLNGAILEEILRIFIPVSKVNNLSFWKQWGIPCFAFVEPRIFQSFSINIISCSCLGLSWVVAKDKQYYLHFKFFRLYPFVFLLNSGWVLIVYTQHRARQMQALPSRGALSSGEERHRNALSPECGHLPEEMFETLKE